jgi:NADH/F420H2 dehydrogenase subunit C
MPRVAEAIQATFGDAELDTGAECGIEVLRILPAAVPDVLAMLRDDDRLAFTMLLDVTAVDGLRLGWPERFKVCYHLYSFLTNERVKIVAFVAEGQAVPSVFGMWKSADWLERETWDQYGIVFEGHPNLVRLLNHKEFVGHPLRKDYDIKKGQWLSEPDDLLDQLEKARQGILPEY